MVPSRSCRLKCKFVVEANSKEQVLSWSRSPPHFFWKRRSPCERYLSRRIETSGNIEVLYRTKIRRTVGEGGRLNGIEVEDAGRKQRRTLRVQAVFSLIGAVPHTAWLPSEIRTDQDGFIKTGRAVLEDRHGLARWPLKRQPRRE
jgi:thioredoxin reductase (NADPH)